MTCPICNKPSEATHQPFCSRRCADVDLGRWLGGGYSLPAQPDEEDLEDVSASAQYKPIQEPTPRR